MAKRYITSDSPRLARTGEYTQYTKPSNRKPRITTQMALKARQKARTVLVKDSREIKYDTSINNIDIRSLYLKTMVNFLAQLLDSQHNAKTTK